MDKSQNELQDLLRDGAKALREMRRGIENACAELRALYCEVLPRVGREAYLNTKKKGFKKQNSQKNDTAFIS
jgi:hypothetical protein